MILVSANPAKPLHFTGRKAKSKTGRKATKKGASAMAKKHRSAAQKAATLKMIAANKAKRHHNPHSKKAHRKGKRRVSRNPVSYHKTRRKVRRNPSLLGMARGSFLGDLLSLEGAKMVAGAFAAPIAIDYIQEKIVPTATGWTKVAIKGGLAVGLGWAIDRFLKQRKLAQAFTVTGLAVVASDAVNIARGQMQGLSASEADMLANRPDLVARVASGDGLGAPYSAGLADYERGLAGGIVANSSFDSIVPLNRANAFGSAFTPSFNSNF